MPVVDKDADSASLGLCIATSYQIATIAGAHDVMAILRLHEGNTAKVDIAPKYIERSHSVSGQKSLNTRGALRTESSQSARYETPRRT